MSLRGKHFISLSLSLFSAFSMPFATVETILICGNVPSEITPRKYSMLEKYMKSTQKTMHNADS
jgi:hypothetical protein